VKIKTSVVTFLLQALRPPNGPRTWMGSSFSQNQDHIAIGGIATGGLRR
jgi:hypothetical protein